MSVHARLAVLLTLAFGGCVVASRLDSGEGAPDVAA